MDQVEAEGMRRTKPDLYQRQRGEGYGSARRMSVAAVALGAVL